MICRDDDCHIDGVHDASTCADRDTRARRAADHARRAAEREKITAEFIRVWQKAASLDEVLAATKMTSRAAQEKAYYLRKKGVPLKRMPAGWKASGKQDFWARLRRVAEESLS